MTKHYAVQLTIGAEWKTLGTASGLDAAEAMTAFTRGKAAHPVVAQPAEHGFPRFDVGTARFRLVPVRQGETTV